MPPIGSPVYESRPPFPQAMMETRKPDSGKDIYEIFRRCEVNIPLLDLLKFVPKYSKFLKELCNVKRNSKSKKGTKVRISE